MKRNIIFSGLALLAISVTLGCNENEPQENDADRQNIAGTEAFVSSIREMNISTTKSGEISEDEALLAITPLFPVAIEYLYLNGYDYTEDFRENDPNIILAALAMAEYDIIKSQAKTRVTATDMLTCVAVGYSVGDLASLGTRQLAKLIAKKLLQRAVPYVGVAVGVASAAVCIAGL